MQAIDFSRSFFTFRIDTLKRPPATYSHAPTVSCINSSSIPTLTPSAERNATALSGGLHADSTIDSGISVPMVASLMPGFVKRQCLSRYIGLQRLCVWSRAAVKDFDTGSLLRVHNAITTLLQKALKQFFSIQLRPVIKHRHMAAPMTARAGPSRCRRISPIRCRGSERAGCATAVITSSATRMPNYWIAAT